MDLTEGEIYAKLARRVRTARRNAGFPTAAAFARAHGLRAASVRRLERGLMRRTSAIMPIFEALCDHHGHTIDRLLRGRKPAPDSIGAANPGRRC